MDSVVQIQEWIETLCEYRDNVKSIVRQIEVKIDEYERIDDPKEADDALVSIPLMCNRIDHMLKVYLGDPNEKD